MTSVTREKESPVPQSRPSIQGVWPEGNSHVATHFPCHVLVNILS